MSHATTIIHAAFGTLRREYDVVDWPGPQTLIQNAQWFLNGEPISDERVEELVSEALAQQDESP